MHTQLALAHIHQLEGKPEEAQAVLRDAAALAKEIGLLREELEARERLSALLREGGQRRPPLPRGKPPADCGSGLRHSRPTGDLRRINDA